MLAFKPSYMGFGKANCYIPLGMSWQTHDFRLLFSMTIPCTGGRMGRRGKTQHIAFTCSWSDFVESHRIDNRHPIKKNDLAPTFSFDQTFDAFNAKDNWQQLLPSLHTIKKKNSPSCRNICGPILPGELVSL